jgi:hypothetical protein
MIDFQLPPMSNAFHCSAYKMAMSNKREKSSLFQRSLIGMDAMYEATFYDKQIGIRFEVNQSGAIVVHSMDHISQSASNINVELIVPGDKLLSIGCISLRSDGVSLNEVLQLLQIQDPPIRLVFESHLARSLKLQLEETLNRLEFSPAMKQEFDVGGNTRELVYQTSLEMIVDFSFNLYDWFDPLRVMHVGS